MATIYEKLLSARGKMSFAKTPKSSGINYEYLKGDEILEMVGNALASEGILFVPSMVHAEITYGEKNGKSFQHAVATIDARFIDTEDGQTLEVTTHGSSVCYKYMALGKAQTYGIKYLFNRMFLKGRDDFNDESTDEPAASQPPARSAAPARPANGDDKDNEPEPHLTNENWPDLREWLIENELADNDIHAFRRLCGVLKVDIEDNPWPKINAAKKAGREVYRLFTARKAEKETPSA